MPAILSPQPRRPHSPRSFHSPIYRLSYSSPPSPPLLSPIQLSPSAIHSPPPIVSPRPISPSHISFASYKIPTSVSNPIAKRRRKPISRPPRRRRPLPRVDCPVEQPHPPSHAFDQLPWISSLDAPPDFLCPWDIADLSQLDPDPLFSTPATGAGPIRRRKSSLRASPLRPAQQPHISFSAEPERVLPSTRAIGPAPTPILTPAPTFNPSRVLFHNLMPHPPDDLDGYGVLTPSPRSH